MLTRAWRDIPRFEGLYSVSSDGLIRRDAAAKGTRIGKLLHQKTSHKNGYAAVLLSHGVGLPRERHYVHRLVARAFLGEPAEGKQVNHRNSDRSDNRVENLEWVTARENIRHCMEAGRFHHNVFHGERHGRAKMTDADARAILASSEPTRVLAERYGVTQTAVWYIRKRKTWRHVR